MSFLFLEIKYARMVGQSIERWKIKSDNPFHGNGRCPVCGDSASNKTKTRFHIIQHDNTLFCKCFNCDYSTNLLGFLKTYHPGMHSEFIFERYRVNGNENVPIIQKPKVVLDDASFKPVKRDSDAIFTLDLPLVSDLPKNDPARLYMEARHLPEYPFMYASEFYKFSSQFNAELSNFKKDEARIVIPFFDRAGNVFAYQGRSLSKTAAQKYITIIVNAKIPKIFGIDRVNFKKPIKIVEGPIDSLFLDNCLASVNASLVSTAKKISGVINKDLVTIIYDNEPRNKIIVGHYDSAIKDGYGVVIWPKSCDGYKDINDLSLAGMNINKIIEKNTFRGLEAQIEFQKWKKI